jgi:hypothetical protein
MNQARVGTANVAVTATIASSGDVQDFGDRCFKITKEITEYISCRKSKCLFERTTVTETEVKYKLLVTLKTSTLPCSIRASLLRTLKSDRLGIADLKTNTQLLVLSCTDEEKQILGASADCNLDSELQWLHDSIAGVLGASGWRTRTNLNTPLDSENRSINSENRFAPLSDDSGPVASQSKSAVVDLDNPFGALRSSMGMH